MTTETERAFTELLEEVGATAGPDGRPALPGAHDDVRLGGRRRRLRHGRLRAGRRRGPRHPGALPRVRLLEHVPVEPAPAHLQLRLRARDHQRSRRSTYEPDGSWIIVVSARRPAHPNWVSTAGHRSGPHLVPLVPARPTRPSSPRSRCCRSPPYERTPGAGPHRRPGRSPLQRRGAGDPRLHGRGRLTAGPRTGRAHGRRPGGDRRWTTSVPTTSSSASTCCAGPCASEGGFNGAGVMQQHTFLLGTAQEPAAHRGPDRAAPRDPRGADRRPDRHLRAAPDGDHPPAQPDVGRPGAAVAPLLGEPRAGPRRPRAARAGRARPAPRAHRDGPVVPRRRPAVLQPDARDDRRAHARGDPAARPSTSRPCSSRPRRPCRSGATHYLARDQRPSYAYLRKILQALQWLRGGTRWVLKSPQHLEQFPALVETFPDATFVVTHRDPVSVTTSMVTMLAYIGPAHPRPRRRRGDRPLLGGPARAHAAPLCRASTTSCRQTRPSTCTSTSSWPTTWPWWRRVYELAGQPLDDSLPGRHDGVHGRAPSRQVRRRRVRPRRSSTWTAASAERHSRSTPSASA